MPLLLTGQAFRRDLEANGCLAVQAPLEGGAETYPRPHLRAICRNRACRLISRHGDWACRN